MSLAPLDINRWRPGWFPWWNYKPAKAHALTDDCVKYIRKPKHW